MNHLLQPTNQFEGMTAHEPRPSRQLKQWRYSDEGSLIRAQDRWDASEQARQHWEKEGARVDRDIAARQAAEEKAAKERSDAIFDGELRRRFVAGGGTLEQFEGQRASLRLDYARKAALGEVESLDPVEITKRELRAIRRNIGPVASEP
jgi:hypothetical protein